MAAWEQLAEARIRSWLDLPAAERETAAIPLEPDVPLEVQLTQDIAQLDRLATATEDAELAALMKRKASDLMLRLMVILERQGRPLAAQHFAQQRLASRAVSER